MRKEWKEKDSKFCRETCRCKKVINGETRIQVETKGKTGKVKWTETKTEVKLFYPFLSYTLSTKLSIFSVFIIQS